MCVFVCMGTHGDQTTTLDVIPQDTVSLVFGDKIAQFYLEFANLVRMAPATLPHVWLCISVCVYVGKRLTLGVILQELSLLFWGKEFLVDLESTIQLGWLANEPGSFIWLLEMELGPKPSFLMYIVLLSI